VKKFFKDNFESASRGYPEYAELLEGGTKVSRPCDIVLTI
jgi:hypothetical protein